MITELDVAIWVPPLVAFGIAFFTSMGGVSGAFLLLPIQLSFLGIAGPSASATNHFYNVLAIPGGVRRYVREQRMVWPLAMAIVVGTVPGVLVGTVVRIVYLPDPRDFKLFVALVLLYIGWRLARSILGAGRGGWSGQGVALRGQSTSPAEGSDSEVVAAPEVRIQEMSPRRIVYTFLDGTHSVSVPGLLTLSLVVGVVGGIYGIGGGSIMAPFLVTVFGLPIHTIAGATLMGTFATSLVGVLFYQALAPFFPDLSVAPIWGLGLLFGAGGMMGMYLGARFQRFVPPSAIKLMLCGVTLFAATKYVLQFIG